MKGAVYWETCGKLLLKVLLVETSSVMHITAAQCTVASERYSQTKEQENSGLLLNTADFKT